MIMIMKIFHTSDWHLGRMLYGRSLIEDQAFFIRQLFLPDIKAQCPDLVMISGDLYDRKVATVPAIRLFDETITALAELHIPVALISGNHDSADRLAVMKPLLRRAGVYISTTLADALSPVTLTADGETVRLFLIPFLDNAQVRDYFQDDSLHGEAACMQRILQKLAPQCLPDGLNLLMAHCYVSGAATCDSESPFSIGGSAAIPAELFEGFDYVALGHLHGPQRVGVNGRYSGSPLKYSVDEAHHKKSYTQLEIKHGCVNPTLVPIRPMRDVRRITGLFDDILAAGKQNICPDYVEIVLEDQRPILMAAERLAPYYPEMLAVRNPFTLQQAGGAKSGVPRKSDERTLFHSFMTDICDMDVTPEEEKLFLDLLRESAEESPAADDKPEKEISP